MLKGSFTGNFTNSAFRDASQFGGDHLLGFPETEKVELTLLGEGSWLKRYVLRQKKKKMIDDFPALLRITLLIPLVGMGRLWSHLAWFWKTSVLRVSESNFQFLFWWPDWGRYLPYAQFPQFSNEASAGGLNVSPQISYVEILTPQRGDCNKVLGWLRRSFELSGNILCKNPMAFYDNCMSLWSY